MTLRPTWSLLSLLLLVTVCPASAAEPQLREDTASRYAQLVLKGVRQEYPNKLDHVMSDASQVLSPRALHPAFYGCFDWHSSVHGHWLLVRLLRQFPALPEAAAVRAVLDEHLSPAAIAVERAYLAQPNRKSFERSYGWAWLLKLSAELESWDSPEARRWAAALRPLADDFAARAKDFLPRQDYPIRTGVHPNTAYSLYLFLDFAEATKDTALESLVKQRARDYFLQDKAAPLGWEPSGEDFLSPSLEEAALLVRILPADEGRAWLQAFLPGLMAGDTLTPAKVSDRSDPKIVHLDGLNLSRARCLYSLARHLGAQHGSGAHFMRLGDLHAEASLPHVNSGNYEGDHWLATFALRLLLEREQR